MLTDSSLTNTLTLTGISNIHYRVYSESYQKSNIYSYFSKDTAASFDLNHSYQSQENYIATRDNDHSISIIKAYRKLITLNVPCNWHPILSPQQDDKEIITLELWVFAFNPTHIHIVDTDQNLKQLKEIKVESFNWEQLISDGLSPTSSPALASSSQGHYSNVPLAPPLTCKNEYQLFIKSIRNLVAHEMHTNKGAFSLGDFFLLPSTADNDTSQPQQQQQPKELSHVTNSMLTCTYTIHMASSHLVFQPTINRMRIRPLQQQDLIDVETKVKDNYKKDIILCPTGELAQLLPTTTKDHISEEFAQKLFDDWIEFYQQTVQVQQQASDMRVPKLVMVKTSRMEEPVFYPGMLVFVPTDSKIASAAAVGGLNGIMGYNCGVTEDVGAKVARQAYLDTLLQQQQQHEELMSPSSVNSNKNVVDSNVKGTDVRNSKSCFDYWSYRDPMMCTGDIVIDALLKKENGGIKKHQQQYHQHHYKASLEAGLVGSQQYGMSDNGRRASKQRSSISSMDDAERARRTQMDLVDFVKQEFGNEQNFDMMVAGVYGTDIKDTNTLEENEPEKNSLQAQISPTNPLEDFDLHSEDKTTYDMDGDISMSQPWDAMGEEFGDLDLDVTEADFDFFKASATIAPLAGLSAKMPVQAVEVSEIQQLASDRVETKDNSLLTPFTLSTNDTLVDELDEAQQYVESVSAATNESATPIEVDILATTKQAAAPQQQQYHSTSNPHTLKTHHKSEITQSFVPKDFLPIDVQTIAINDAKYEAGGKFMYDPSSSEKKEKENQNQLLQKKNKSVAAVTTATATMYYSPNYKPLQAAKKKRRVKNSISKPSSLVDGEDIKMKDIEYENSESDSSSSVSSYSDSDTDTDSSSSDNSSSTSSPSPSTVTQNLNTVITTTLQKKHISATSKFQSNTLSFLLGSTPASSFLQVNHITQQQRRIDYDVPFTPVLAHGPIHPIQYTPTQSMHRSLHHLCQQAVWGGYPFASGLSEACTSGGEIESETTQLIAARRSNLKQVMRGAVTHVPALRSDASQIIIGFKSVLESVFGNEQQPQQHQKQKEDELKEENGRQQMVDTPSASLYLNETVSNSSGSNVSRIVYVKGPLTIKQYYSLNDKSADIQSTVKSRYGKYQIRKKRPDEPSLYTPTPPSISVSRRDNILEGSPKMLPFWDKIGLAPYSIKKHLQYYIVYPENSDVDSSIRQFFKSLSCVYNSCHLGLHEPAGHSSVGNKFHRGLVPVPRPLFSTTADGGGEMDVQQCLENYEDVCEELGRHLAATGNNNRQQQQQQQPVYTVVYIINPISSNVSSYLDMCRCFDKLKEAYNKFSREDENTRIVLQLVPVEHVLRSTAFGGYSILGMKDIAFSVYTKCFQIMTRKINHVQQDTLQINEIYAPPFVLSKGVPSQIRFKLNDIRPFPIIFDQDAQLHMAYCFSYDEAWMACVWVDGYGELIEYALLPCKVNSSMDAAFRNAAERTAKIASCTQFSWMIVVTKIGLMFHDELTHWSKYMDILSGDARKYEVVVVALDLESGMSLHFGSSCFPSTAYESNDPHHQQKQGEALDNEDGSLPQRKSGLGTYEAFNAASNSNSNDSKNSNVAADLTSEVQILVLNHRVSYSQKREQSSKSILEIEPLNEKENWMVSLATGYLIQHALPNKSVNPCMEQFHNEEFVAEIHLVYNHTRMSSYDALHHIIKGMYALSFVNPVMSMRTCLPFHVVLAERLSRLLLFVQGSNSI